MEYIYGLLTGVAFFAFAGTTLYLGYTLGKRTSPVKQKEDDRELDRQQKLHKSFVELMNYDMEKALQRKKVD